MEKKRALFFLTFGGKAFKIAMSFIFDPVVDDVLKNMSTYKTAKYSTIETKIKRLNELKAKGLITQEEYKKSKKELIESSLKD